MESQGQPCLKGLPSQPPRATADRNDTDPENLPNNKRQLEHSSLPPFKKQKNDVAVSTRMKKSDNIPSVLLDEDEEDENDDKTTTLTEDIQVQRNLDRTPHHLPVANDGTVGPSTTILTGLIQDETEGKLVQHQIKVLNNNGTISLAEDKCTKEATPLDNVPENTMMNHCHGDISKEKDSRLSTIHHGTKDSSTIIISPTGHENVCPNQSSAVVDVDTGLEYGDICKQVVSNCGTQSDSEITKKERKNKAPIKLDLDNLQLLNVGGEYMDTLPSMVTMTSSNQDSVIGSHGDGAADVQNTGSNKSLSQSQPVSTQSTIVLNSNNGNQKPNDIEAIPIHVYPQGQGISLVTSSGILTADISTFSTQVPAILTEGDADDADTTANFSEQFHIVTTSNVHPGNPQIPGQSTNEMLSVMMSSSDLGKSVILTSEQQQAILGEVMTPGVAGGQTLHITIPHVTTSGHQPIVTGSDGNLLCGDQEGVDGGQVRAIQVQLLQTNDVNADNKGSHEDRGKSRSCPHQDCGKVCHRASKLKMPTMANSAERPYKCPHGGCEWAFATAYKLKRHERGHTGERPFVCHFEDCNRRFTTAYNLKTHTRAHNRTNTIQCQYEGCDKSFPTLHKYRVHERRHQQDDKPFKCEVHGCSKEFSAMSTLASHLKSHSGERPHGCPVEGCDKRFTKASKLKLHLRTHTGERPFACDVEGCGWSFTSAYKLKRHMRKHTGERPFVCTYEGCHKSFTRSSHLKTHTLVHTGEKPYVCPMDGCNKAFTAGSSLNVHMRKHTGEKPFRCEEDGCTKAYTTASNLRAHQKRHDKTQRIIEGSQEQPLPSDFVTVNTMSSASNTSSLVDNDPEVTYTGINTFTSEDFASEDVTTIPVSVHFPPGSVNTIVNNAGNQLTLSTAGSQDHSDSTEEQGKGQVTTVTLPVANLDVDGGHIDVTEFVVHSDNVEPVLQSHEVSKHSDGDHLKHDSGFDLSITSIVSHLQSHETSPNSKLNSSDVLGTHRGERLLIDGKLRTLEFRTPVNPEDQFKPPAVIFQEEKSGSSDTEGEIPQTHSDLPTTTHGLMQITLPQEVIQIRFPSSNSPVPPIPDDNEAPIEMESTAGHRQLQAFEASSLSELQGNNLSKAQISPYMEDDSPDPDDSQVDNYPESTINLQDLR